jgi:hypothetical protein
MRKGNYSRICPHLIVSMIEIMIRVQDNSRPYLRAERTRNQPTIPLETNAMVTAPSYHTELLALSRDSKVAAKHRRCLSQTSPNGEIHQAAGLLGSRYHDLLQKGERKWVRSKVWACGWATDDVIEIGFSNLMLVSSRENVSVSVARTGAHMRHMEWLS